MSITRQEQWNLNRREWLQGVAGVAAGLVGSGRLLGGQADEPVGPASSSPSASTGKEPLTLEQSLRLAGDNLLAILNPEANHLPYWQMAVAHDYKAELRFWWPAHNLGRWWDAMLRLEQAIGFKLPPAIEAAMLENTKRFFNNPDHISLSPDRVKEWDLHSLREGMLALHGLARWRKSDWAADMARQMAASVNAKLRDDGKWDLDQFDAYRKRGGEVIHNLQPCDTHGRMLEALVWCFEATGDGEVFRLAERIARWHFANTTQPDGRINPAAHADHTHSYLGTLRGLLLWGRLTRQREYIDRVAATYRLNIPNIMTPSGYTSHNMVSESFGETTSPGDAAQLALWLFLEGHTDFIDDVERLVRARILASQIRSSPPLQPTVDDGKDAHHELNRRVLGGYGGCHRHPCGDKQAVTDVTAADVHTLVDIYQHVAAAEDGRLEVRFHFDHEDAVAKITSRRAQRGQLTVTPKQRRSVAARIPGWVPRASLRMTVGGADRPPVYAGQFAWAHEVPAGTPVVLEYDLPERQSQERGLGSEYELYWRGDDVIGVRPNTDFYPYYPDAPAKS